jgi:hypothetical protein
VCVGGGVTRAGVVVVVVVTAMGTAEGTNVATRWGEVLVALRVAGSRSGAWTRATSNQRVIQSVLGGVLSTKV